MAKISEEKRKAAHFAFIYLGGTGDSLLKKKQILLEAQAYIRHPEKI